MPYLTEFCLFVAAFLAAFFYGDSIIRRFGIKHRLAAWQRRRRR
jgi:hypothetical protein